MAGGRSEGVSANREAEEREEGEGPRHRLSRVEGCITISRPDEIRASQIEQASDYLNTLSRARNVMRLRRTFA